MASTEIGFKIICKEEYQTIYGLGMRLDSDQIYTLQNYLYRNGPYPYWRHSTKMEALVWGPL